MTSLKRLIAGALLILVTPGCATLLQNGPDNIPVHTNPEGADTYLDGQYIGKTPLIASVPRKSDGIFRFEMKGYETQTMDKDKVVNGWFFGNLLVGGLIGITVDLIASNQGKYSDAPINVPLKQESASDKRNPASVGRTAPARP